MANGMLVMKLVGDEELYSHLKLGLQRAVWQPAWCSCQPLSARRSSLLPSLHSLFHPHCASLSWSSTFSSCPKLTVRMCSRCKAHKLSRPPQGPGVRASGRRGPTLLQCPDPGVLALGPRLVREGCQ